MRVIDAEPIIEKLKNAIYFGKRVDANTDNLEAIFADIEAQPAELSEYCDKLWKTAYERGKAEAHPKKGKWVYDEERGARGIYAICTACNEMIYQTGGFNYCPNCGAKMEESDE